VTSLRDQRLAGGVADGDEASLLAAYRALDPTGRRQLLERARPAATPVNVPPPPAWLQPESSVAPVPPPDAPPVAPPMAPLGASLGAPPFAEPTSLAELFAVPAPSLAAAPEALVEPLPAVAAAPPEPVRPPGAVANPIVVKAPPAPWLTVQPEAGAQVLAFPAREPEPQPLVDSALDELFARLDFGPPAATLLAATAGARAEAGTADSEASAVASSTVDDDAPLAPVIALRTPIEVARTATGRQDLPTPTPAFGGWLS
jgi:Meckel syndrome type 1 protein